MRFHRPLLTLSLCALTLACGSSDDSSTSPLAGSSLSLNTVTAATDATGVSTIRQGDQVGITLWDGSNGETLCLNQQLAVGENGALVGTESVTIPSDATSVNLFAYIPYRSEWSTNVNYRRVEVYADQSTYENYHASDLLIGTPVGGNPVRSTNVQLNFEHVMARINVELTDPTEQVGISEAAIRIINVLTAVFVNPYTGEVSTIEGQTGSILTYRTLGTDLTRSNRRETKSAILPAQTITAGTPFIEIYISAKKYTFGIPETITLTQGAEYNYALVLNGDEVELLSTTVRDWNAQGTTDIYVDDPTQD